MTQRNRRSRTYSFNIAFCGIVCALSILFMYMSLIPAMTYVVPAVSGLLIWTVCEQINRKWAILAYCALSLLLFLLLPEKEAFVFFVIFFGYYPTVRDLLVKIKPAPLSWLLRFAVFNVAIVAGFQLLTYIIGLNKLLEGMEGFGEAAVYILWLMADFAFVFYDLCIPQAQFAYVKWVKTRLNKRIK